METIHCMHKIMWSNDKRYNHENVNAQEKVKNLKKTVFIVGLLDIPLDIH